LQNTPEVFDEEAISGGLTDGRAKMLSRWKVLDDRLVDGWYTQGSSSGRPPGTVPAFKSKLMVGTEPRGAMAIEGPIIPYPSPVAFDRPLSTLMINAVQQ
jgi:hypothetical protein